MVNYERPEVVNTVGLSTLTYKVVISPLASSRVLSGRLSR